VVQRLSLDLEHCYGIKKLQAKLDFSSTRAIAVYAPNGSMKSSLAQTFQDIADEKDSKDRIFPARVCKRVITDETGAELPPASVLVVRPYEEAMGHSTKTATLLVNANLRAEYEKLHEEIDTARQAFLRGLSDQSGSRRDLEKEISLAFTASPDKFYVALNRIKDEVANRPDSPLKDIPYDLIFDEKVQSFLDTKDFKTAIDGFIKKYNELLAASTYFKKGVFTHYNAAQIAKHLADNNFFKGGHSVNLNAGQKTEISSQAELEDLIAKEKEAILKDKNLRKSFADIEKVIHKNVTVREFESYLLDHEELLTKFANMADFRQEVWKAYIDTRYDLYRDLLDKYQAAEVQRVAIKEKANEERTQWEEVIEIFNDRFFVPFTLVPSNRVDVILGQDEVLSLGFIFDDGSEQASVEHESLLQALSTGEKKALYVLNILFEIEARKKAGQETLIIVDDVADSFDYKNKYAIIQYLIDISENQHFKQLILTHNFDFYRTVVSRFVHYPNAFMTSKTKAGVVFEKASGINNVFIKDWKEAFYTDAKKKIGSIAFMRNLIEYTRGATDPDYITLTSLLHWKADSSSITIAQLDDIYNRLFAASGRSAHGSKSVMDLIAQEAGACLAAPSGINFANKVVLAIATRIAAERFMIAKINDPAFVASIDEKQTTALLTRFEQMFPSKREWLVVLQRVVLMTPENIHLNAFMYEPILDMSDEHLKKLYREVSAL
jgi:energy-coupling factor transporter ATP-binding protein EcfA2